MKRIKGCTIGHYIFILETPISRHIYFFDFPETYQINHFHNGQSVTAHHSFQLQELQSSKLVPDFLYSRKFPSSLYRKLRKLNTCATLVI